MRTAGWIALGLVVIAAGMVVPLAIGWAGWDRSHVDSSAMSRYGLVLAIAGAAGGYWSRRTLPGRAALFVGIGVSVILAGAIAV